MLYFVPSARRYCCRKSCPSTSAMCIIMFPPRPARHLSFPLVVLAPTLVLGSPEKINFFPDRCVSSPNSLSTVCALHKNSRQLRTPSQTWLSAPNCWTQTRNRMDLGIFSGHSSNPRPSASITVLPAPLPILFSRWTFAFLVLRFVLASPTTRMEKSSPRRVGAITAGKGWKEGRRRGG